MPPDEYDHVMARDGECIIAKLWREGKLVPHKPCPPRESIGGRQTAEHVKELLGMSIRAPHSRRWMVRACQFHNADGECSRQRDVIRDHLARLYPDTR